MENVSAWQRLETSLRRLIRFRELGAPPEVIDEEIRLARRHFANVPPVPRGVKTQWDEDLEAVARELGFLPDPREGPPMGEWLAGFGGNVTKAAALYNVVQEIARELRNSVRIEDLQVVGAGSTYRLHGVAADAASRERATQIAQRVAGGATIENHLTVRGAEPG